MSLSGSILYIASDETKQALRVSNIAPETTRADVHAIFSPFGRISELRLPEGEDYAIVKFRYPSDAPRAIQILQGQEFGGKKIVLELVPDVGHEENAGSVSDVSFRDDARILLN